MKLLFLRKWLSQKILEDQIKVLREENHRKTMMAMLAKF